MKLCKLAIIAIAIPFLQTSCASTRASATEVHTQANFTYMKWQGGTSPSLVMYGGNHSVPTRAGGSVIGTTSSGIVAAITALAAYFAK